MAAINPGAPPAPAPPVNPEAAPPSTGQPPQQAPQQDGFRGRFPDIPDDQWSQLEPHLKGVQAHVTQLEQKAAPFKNYTPDQVVGLKNFADQFDSNPMGMFLALASDLQKRGVLHDDLDLEALAAISQGQDPDEGGPEAVPGAPEQGQQPQGDPWAEAPEWAQQMKARMDQQDQREQESQRQQVERTEDAALKGQLKWMTDKLKEAGVDEKFITEQRLLGMMIAHNGNPQAAVQEEIQYRTTILQGLVLKERTDVETPTNLPTTKKRGGRPRDSFAKAGDAAEQYLKRAAHEAQT